MQCARTYLTEAQIPHVVRDFATWHDLVAANFPPYEIPEDAEPYDPRDADEKWREQVQRLQVDGTARQLDGENWRADHPETYSRDAP